jgi:hypothetical protein
VQDTVAEVRNLTNSEDKSGFLVASFEGRPRAMQSGKIKFKVAPYAKEPTFDASLQLNGLELPHSNPYLRAIANVDVEKGTLALDAGFAGKRCAAGSKGRWTFKRSPAIRRRTL